jgi:L-fuculose-phosphate aldolase
MPLSFAEQVLQIKHDIVALGKQLYSERMIVATDGNISVRITEETFLITRSGICKGRMTIDDIITVDLQGRVIEGHGNPSSETRLHIVCYEERDDIAAIVHAHPPTAVAFSIAGKSLAICVIPEVVVALGPVPTVPYLKPTTKKIAESIRPVIRHADALILEKHGAVCVGEDLSTAADRLEKLEHSSEIMLMAHQLGGIKTLAPTEVKELIELREKFNLGGRNPLCNSCVMGCFEGLPPMEV